MTVGSPGTSGAALGRADRWLRKLHGVVVVPCMLALLAACGVLTYSVVVRYFYQVPTDWQDEAAVFLLVGATFLSGGWLQAQRGHVSIEALASLLPSGINRVRKIFADSVTALFCAFFAWKSWALFHTAWSEGQTSSSLWGPPMWIPYSLMAVGMTLLVLQTLMQAIHRITRLEEA